ncbi:Panacea domain-containing protein [Leucobacter aridicollis]|uniref:Putative phage-associated protein n=1 Tax=Leucobacter aridicollis TaxID=283878 RepID=A0A852QXN7_9MICO|nr:Panacea domain-containing protein [Leucobacter aridicollis]NYD26111.1 putative phage-associated protein [Leucobacter aridicollis]
MNNLKLEKYENVILYLCSKLPEKAIQGKVKLAKLLYYVDFDRFEFNESMESVTGDGYRRLPMGPVPKSMTGVINSMSGKGLLEVTEEAQFAGRRNTTVFRAQASPDLSVFSPEDMAIIDRVVRKYLPLTGKQLQDLSHEEAPWLAVEHKDTIPLELAFYRDTDFTDAA